VALNVFHSVVLNVENNNSGGGTDCCKIMRSGHGQPDGRLSHNDTDVNRLLLALDLKSGHWRGKNSKHRCINKLQRWVALKKHRNKLRSVGGT
jgi:hypothetical protein